MSVHEAAGKFKGQGLERLGDHPGQLLERLEVCVSEIGSVCLPVCCAKGALSIRNWSRAVASGTHMSRCQQ